MVADFRKGKRTKYLPNSSDTRIFIWWSISHKAVWAIWAGNSSISMPKNWSTSHRMLNWTRQVTLDDRCLSSARKTSSSSKRNSR